MSSIQQLKGMNKKGELKPCYVDSFCVNQKVREMIDRSKPIHFLKVWKGKILDQFINGLADLVMVIYSTQKVWSFAEKEYIGSMVLSWVSKLSSSFRSKSNSLPTYIFWVSKQPQSTFSVQLLLCNTIFHRSPVRNPNSLTEINETRSGKSRNQQNQNRTDKRKSK